MGKRELLIAIAFVAIGVAAYEFTAPPPKAGERGFSFSQFWNNARRGMRGNAAQDSFTRTGTIATRAAHEELRIAGLNRGVRILGESRTDIAYELAVSSTGPDQKSALALAQQVTIKEDDLGNILALRVTYPRGGSQTASLVLRVPSRLTARVDGGNGAYASKIAGIDLENINGDVTIVDVSGPVTGQHRNGDLRVAGAGAIKMTLQRSQAKFEHIERGLTLDVRDGELTIDNSKGPIELDGRGTEIAIAQHAGPIRVGGSGGRVSIIGPREATKVDVRSEEVEVTLTQPVPVTLLTTENTLRLFLDGTSSLTLDAVASEGQIQADDFNLHAEPGDREARLTHVFGANGPRVSLRNSRGEIVIRKTK